LNYAGKVLTAGDILDMELEEIVWISKPFFAEGTLSEIEARAESLKSWASILLGICIATGRKWFNYFEVKQGNFLFLDNEANENEIKRRLNIVMNGMNLTKKEIEQVRANFHYWNPGKFLNDEAFLNEVRKYIKKHNISLVVVDSFREFTSHNENDSGECSIFFNSIKKVMKETKAGFVFIHHQGKESLNNKRHRLDASRGSSQIIGAMRSVLKFQPKDNNRIEVEHIKSNLTKKEQPFIVECTWTGELPGEDAKHGLTMEYNETAEVKREKYQKTKAEACADRIKEYIEFNDSFTTNEIRNKVCDDFTYSTTTNALNDLIDLGYIKTDVKGVYKKC